MSSSSNNIGVEIKALSHEFKIITEGQASMVFSERNEVFYNKVQEFNRDISIHVLKYFAEIRMRELIEKDILKDKRNGKKIAEDEVGELDNKNWSEQCSLSAKESGITILDALAATALRSIRYVKEIPGVKKVIANDVDGAAVEAARRNMEHNNVDCSLMEVRLGDAESLMYSSRLNQNQFDVVDLDPYGSAVPFIDAAVQAVNSGGLLCITCTDMPVLSGGKPDSCYMKYGSMPTKRIIHPVLSLSVDFYVRLFVRIFDDRGQARNVCSKLGYVFQSSGCPSFYIQPMSRKVKDSYKAAFIDGKVSECSQTGFKMKIGGPVWIDRIHDEKWVNALLHRINSQIKSKDEQRPSTAHRIASILTTVSEELHDVPLHYNMAEICSVLHCNAPSSADIRSAIINAGYRISAFHKDPNAIKTDAPDDILWDIMRCWVKKQPVNPKRLKPGTPCFKILSVEPKANFTRTKGSVLSKITRFHENPEPNWGPMKKATGKKRDPEPEVPEEKKRAKAADLIVQQQEKSI